MTISVRLNDNDIKLIKKYAKLKNTTLSDLIRTAVLEKIEDEYELECYNKAIKEFDKNPKTYTLDEVKKELGLQLNISQFFFCLIPIFLPCFSRSLSNN